MEELKEFERLLVVDIKDRNDIEGLEKAVSKCFAYRYETLAEAIEGMKEFEEEFLSSTGEKFDWGGDTVTLHRVITQDEEYWVFQHTI